MTLRWKQLRRMMGYMSEPNDDDYTSITVTVRTSKLVDRFAEQFNAKKGPFLERLLTRFHDLGEEIQLLVLGHLRNKRGRQLLEAIANELREKEGLPRPIDPPKGTRVLIVTDDVYKRLEHLGAGKRSAEDYVAEHAVTRTKDLEIGQPKGAGHEEQTSSQSSR
jgi:predicted CopG family antitoxin